MALRFIGAAGDSYRAADENKRPVYLLYFYIDRYSFLDQGLCSDILSPFLAVFSGMTGEVCVMYDVFANTCPESL